MHVQFWLWNVDMFMWCEEHGHAMGPGENSYNKISNQLTADYHIFLDVFIGVVW